MENKVIGNEELKERLVLERWGDHINIEVNQSDDRVQSGKRDNELETKVSTE